MTEQFYRTLLEGSALVAGLFIIWQILREVFKFFSKNEEGNQLERSVLSELLTNTIASLTVTLAKNTEVLADIKLYLQDERRVRHEDIKGLHNLINPRFDALERLILDKLEKD